MREPEQHNKTLADCADNLERLYMIFNDLGTAVTEQYPGISFVIGDYALALKKEELYLREY